MSVRGGAGSALDAVVSRDPDVHSGELVFAGTRVPVETFIDYLTGGATVEEFLAGFPTVERRQADAFLRLAFETIERLAAGDPVSA